MLYLAFASLEEWFKKNDCNVISGWMNTIIVASEKSISSKKIKYI